MAEFSSSEKTILVQYGIKKYDFKNSYFMTKIINFQL